MKDIKALDIVSCLWLHHEGPQAVVPHPERGLLLVPLTMVEPSDNEQFTRTHAKAAYRSVTALEGKDFAVIGRMTRRWVKDGL